MSEVQIINKVFEYVRNCGNLVNTAKSAYGADRWEFGCLAASLEDEGYTKCIIFTNHNLVVSHTMGEVDYRSGDRDTLLKLFNGLFNATV